jgi:4-hydroxyacetophenone monooxygenase
MNDMHLAARPELCSATDEQLEDAINFVDPMVLRGMLYQLTGDPAVAAIEVKPVLRGYYELAAVVREEDIGALRRKMADFLKSYRDAGAGPIDIGPTDRLPESLELMFGETVPPENVDLYLEEFALDPWARSLRWQAEPDPERLKGFTVTIIGAGMGGLNAALQLKRAGIPYVQIEKNKGVGGTWHENRYPGARVDTPSRSYTHIFGVDFGYPNPFCPWTENERYFNWIADAFDLRGEMVLETEVTELNWDEAAGEWEIRMRGPDGERVHRSRAVITSVGFLNRPNIPEIEGADSFAGKSWHSARWPDGESLAGKRVAVIGTGCSGYQMIPEIALEAAHLTVFQRTPQWLFSVPGYRSPFPPQVSWLDRNLPFHTNFMRARTANNSWFARLTTIDPDFSDPYACSPSNKAARDTCLAFLDSKIADPELRAAMVPEHPVWSARAVVVDAEYSVLDAIQRDNVTLVTDGIERIDPTGIVDAAGVYHDVDVIVYATGFHAHEYLFPMKVTGRDGQTLDQLWSDGGGARAYLGCMMPGFPNLWSIYGPNTNGGLPVATFHEMVGWYALQCIERLILGGERTMEVKSDSYWRYNELVDRRNKQMVWSDPRAHNYYWQPNGRSATMNPFTPPEMWRFLRKPDLADMEIRP